MKTEFIPTYTAGVCAGMTLVIIIWAIYEHFAIKDREKYMNKYVNDSKQASQKHIDYLYQTIDRYKNILIGYKKLSSDKNKLLDEQFGIIENMVNDYNLSSNKRNN